MSASSDLHLHKVLVALLQVALRHSDTHWQLDIFVHPVDLDPRGRLGTAFVQDVSSRSGHRSSGGRQQCNDVEGCAQHHESG